MFLERSMNLVFPNEKKKWESSSLEILHLLLLTGRLLASTSRLSAATMMVSVLNNAPITVPWRDCTSAKPWTVEREKNSPHAKIVRKYPSLSVRPYRFTKSISIISTLHYIWALAHTPNLIPVD